MPKLLIRNASIVKPDGSIFEGDLLCQHGVIERIAPRITTPADETIDAGENLLLPGVIDPQVHFREPGREHKEDLGTGSRAAVKGGVTSFLEMPNTDPPTTTQLALDDKLRRAAEKCVAHYGFFIGATPDNLDDINQANPVCGIKIFMGASTGNLLVDKAEDLERIFSQGDRLIAVHAEDEQRIRARREHFKQRADVAAHSEIRDNESALLATKLALSLSRKYHRRLHILHLSTREEVELLRQDKPSWVTAEVIPNHLFLNVADYADLGTLVQMNPPIRSANDNTALWKGLHDGTIDFVATDHAPHTLEEKRTPFPDSPAGMPGVETSLPLMLTEVKAGRVTLAEIQKWMCYGPAETYGIPNKGRLLEGWDADLTLVDMKQVKPVRNDEMFTKVHWSPFNGRKLTGWPQFTIIGGCIVYDRGKIREGVRGRPLQFTGRQS